MKKILFLSLVLGACSGPTTTPDQGSATTTAASVALEAAAPVAAVDEKYGFRDRKFGDDISLFPGLTLNKFQSKGDLKIYEASGDQNMKVGTTPLAILRYSFYKDKFYAVDMQPTGEKAMDVLAALTTLYGPPNQPDPQKQNYWWSGQRATATLQKLQHEAPWVSIWSNELSRQVEADQKALNQQAGKAASADL